MEVWNEICFLVNQYRKPNATERNFQIEAEHLFEKLGWSRYKGEIISQQVIPIGSAQSLKPDIIIKQGGKRLFVIELKKPGAELNSRYIDQLISYMLQLRLSIGLIIGDSIQVYYDLPEDNENPVKIIEIPFIPDNVNGAELMSLLQKDSYSEESLSSWCLQKLEERSIDEQIHNTINSLATSDGQELVMNLLKNYLSETYSADLIMRVLDMISIQVGINKQPYTTATKVNREALTQVYAQEENYNKSGDKLKIDLIPTNPEFKNLLLKKKQATIIIYYRNGREEKQIWYARNFNESSDVMRNLRSRAEFRQGEWQKRGIAKVVCVIDE